MNDLLDGWSSPWRAFHRSLAAAVPLSDRKQDPLSGSNSWLGRARAAEIPRLRPATATDLYNNARLSLNRHIGEAGS
jgi:hypothetical protein